MATLKSKLLVWWLTKKQIHTTKTAIATLENQRYRIWERLDKLQQDADEINIASTKAVDNSEDLNLLYHSLKDQVKALHKERGALAGQIAAYELFLLKVKHGLWHPLTGRATPSKGFHRL